MPEIPDIEAYIEALRPRVLGRRWLGVRLVSPFLLRSVVPPLERLVGGTVNGVERLGKRIVFEIEVPASPGDDRPAATYFLVLHLMIAGRLQWRPVGAPVPKGRGLAAFDFESGTLVLTEAGKTRRASLHLAGGREELALLDPGGLEVIGSTAEAFAGALRRENHTLKRALTDPHIVRGIGNAYSDEILHYARLSPFKQTGTLSDLEIERLHHAAITVLGEWIERLRVEAREAFPTKVTAFRPEMAVHGRFGEPCPVCGTRVQRIVYAQNECDYCPTCQTGGRILADRSLSRLLRDDWPRTVDDLERPPTADDSRKPV